MNNVIKPAFYGVLASAILLGLYFAILALISGLDFAQSQFYSFWYFIIGLSAGFGIQIGLYVYLRNLVRGGPGSGKVLGVTGATSAVTMISCCTHYLANLLPILGAIGAITFVAQYQIQLFWVGLLFNIGGILYMANRIFKFKKA